MEEFLDDYPEAGPVHLTELGSSLQKGTKLFVGRLFTIHGSIPAGADRFSFNFLAGGTDGDVALHVDNRFGEQCVVRNSRVAGDWQREEREGGFPLVAGTDFEMMVAVEDGHFKVAYNGNHFTEFVHRLPPIQIDTVTVGGDVDITSYKEAMAHHTFGAFGDALHPIQSDGQTQSYEIHKGMKPGRKIHIGGIALGETFIADLRPDIVTDEIGLHMSCRVAEGLVVFNSKMEGEWQEEVRVTNMPFAPDQHFDILISASDSGFSIVLNGSSVINFFPLRHIKAKKLKGLVIHGSVKVNYVTSIRED